MNNTLATTLNIEEVIILPLTCFVRHGYLQHRALERNKSHTLRYHVYFILSDIQLKDAKAYAYGDSLMAAISETATTVNRAAAKVVDTHGLEGEYVRSEIHEGVPQVKNYFISFEIPEE